MIIPIWTDIDGKDWERCVSDLTFIPEQIEIYAKELQDSVMQYLRDQGHQPIHWSDIPPSSPPTQFTGTNAILTEAINACKEKIKQKQYQSRLEAYQDFQAFLDGPYKENCQKAYDLGVQARKAGLPKVCDVTDDPKLCHNGKMLKEYERAWRAGWDGYKVPQEFVQMEQILQNIPTRPMTEEDI